MIKKLIPQHITSF